MVVVILKNIIIILLGEYVASQVLWVKVLGLDTRRELRVEFLLRLVG